MATSDAQGKDFTWEATDKAAALKEQAGTGSGCQVIFRTDWRGAGLRACLFFLLLASLGERNGVWRAAVEEDTGMTMAKVNSRANCGSELFAGKQWQQVLERDASADGQFFYAVKSTGIYCKPSCASRGRRGSR